MEKYDIKRFIIYECKNYLQIFFKHNDYIYKLWFEYLDYYNIDTYDKLIPVIIPIFIINLLLCYIIIFLVKRVTNNSYKKKYYSKFF